MKIINQTHWDTRTLRIIAIQARDLHMISAAKTKMVTVTFKRRARSKRYGITHIGGRSIEVSLSKNASGRSAIAATSYAIAWVCGHRNANEIWDPENHAEYRMGIPFLHAGLPLAKKAPKPKATPLQERNQEKAVKAHARAVDRVSDLEKDLLRVKGQIKRAKSHAKKCEKKLAYYGRVETVKNERIDNAPTEDLTDKEFSERMKRIRKNA